ncbi:MULTISPECIES: arylsulfatase [unclassified Pseudomonas]|uniref:arylsulfatase n=1 Tax=unclassified Pseudomonas TaxID=196821 RepID=UPI0008760894|nr:MULTISPECIES: arylsulfatase [unclassified Pseudomonas]SCZ39953.1 arylsulfatase [Pseudomonas sp. NFACC44-2]SDA89820.1 arylsulfatase [Pseudomonas sp. NFACC51]SDW42664.1 arylsulfatase [Pseudomonas sp. NFACC08-1]SFI16563.1 arylsulfatase [Pseudomonas sp. NFACC54]SFT28411.1 arylsulfatase [Pseudomonas sp. NFACC48-1]
MLIIRRGMNLYLQIFWGAVLVFLAGMVHAEQAGVRTPNVLIIVADDMGYTDIGAFGGSDIHTPNIDRLASSGIRLNNFHTLPTCAPTRSVLLTGVDNHLSGIGSQVLSDDQVGRPGYEGHLNQRVVTLAEVLARHGYRTYQSGKWHLGDEPRYGPSQRGFQESFALLPGGASHYSDARPLHPAEPTVYVRNGEVVDKLPEGFYSTRDYTNWLVQWLERDRDSQKPFFAYLAYTAPHDPLQAPSDYIAKYRGVYDAGYEVLREKRFNELKALGLIDKARTLAPWPEVVARWDSLSESERANSRRDMEVYAAMIDFMDEQIGRVLDLLERQGELDNTLILFMSDNGANGAPTKVYSTHTRSYHESFDNSLENRGANGSFISQGAGWATASTAAFSMFKFFVYEGGIRTPAIVKPVGAPIIGRNVSAFTHVRDIVPTVLAMVGISHPALENNTLAPLEGRSLLPLLYDQSARLQPLNGVGYEMHGSRAYIDGDWKAVQTPMPLGSGLWQLFDLRTDPGETRDLSRQHPEILAELRNAHSVYEQDHGIIYSPPGAIAVAHTLFKGLVLLAFAIITWQFAVGLKGRGSMGKYGQPTSVGLGISKLVLLGLTFTAWRNPALMLLMGLGGLEIALALRGERRRWRFGMALALLVVLAVIWLLSTGLGLRIFLREYS